MANITGTGNNDILPGTALDDFINGLGGNDTITADDGNDIIIGSLGADTVLAGNGDDEIWGGGSEWAAGDVIDGGAGNNKLCTWGGNISNVTLTNVQTLGTHLNTLSLKASQLAAFSAIIAYGGPLTLQATEAGTYSLQGKSVTGVFSITGSGGNDYLAGNGAAQTLSGGDGNDRLQGLGGADILLGGNGDDEFLTGFTESPAGETIDGGAGFNTLSSWNVDLSNATVSNVQKLNAALDRVTLTAAQLAGFTTLTTGSAQIDLIAAGAGSYSLQGKSVSGKFNLIGSSGNDYLAGNGAAQTLAGGMGNDVLQGAAGADVMLGGDGDDEFLTGFNESVNETIDGGAGNNTLSSWNADLSTTTITNIQTLGLHLDRVTLTAAQWNSFSRIVAYDGAFTIYAATPGAYRLYPIVNAPNYSFVGTAGNDYVNDGTLTFPVTTSNRTISMGAGDDIVQLGLNNDTVYGGTGNDVIHYRGGLDKMFGEDGDDGFSTVGNQYYSENFTIDGGSGYNSMSSFGTNISSATISNIQELYLSLDGITLTQAQLAGFQTVTAIDGTATIRFATQVSPFNLPYFYNTNFVGDFHVYGSSFNDSIFGLEAASLIDGAEGDDYIYALNPPNPPDETDHLTVLGGSGIDTLDVVGSWHVFADGGEGNDTIICYSPYENTLHGGAGDDVFKLSGSLFTEQTIDGGSGYDIIDLNGPDYGVLSLDKESTITNIEEVRFSHWSATIGAQTFAPGTAFVSTTESTLLTIGGNGVFDLGQYNLTGQFNLRTMFPDVGSPDYTLTLIGTDDAQNMQGDLSIYGNVTLYGRGGDDNLFSGDTMYGEEGNDTLSSYIGANTLVGGTGDDLYYIGFSNPASVQATISESDADAGNVDVVQFLSGSGANYDQLWFTRSGDDLVIQSIGTTNTCTIEDWYLGDAQQVEQIKSGDNKMLIDSQVQNLVNAMAAFAVPTTTTLPPDYRAVLDPILAANWT